MKFTSATLAFLSLSTSVLSHPERLTPKNLEHQKMEVGRSTGKCASAIEARKEKILKSRSERLLKRRIASGKLDRRDVTPSTMSRRNELKYTTIQNDTCVLAPETVWGPYA